ncbi:hypothetical protein [Nocardia farcinica]|uniref:hypothetical protein n=1 Tax=Nocardia farcinica TaxID=37329 RepID=UPI002455E4C9|nr:hypothetical protein [Nocardia farcinica]
MSSSQSGSFQTCSYACYFALSVLLRLVPFMLSRGDPGNSIVFDRTAPLGRLFCQDPRFAGGGQRMPFSFDSMGNAFSHRRVGVLGLRAGLFREGDPVISSALNLVDFANDGGRVREPGKQVVGFIADGGEFFAQVAVAVQQAGESVRAVGDRMWGWVLDSDFGTGGAQKA